jgi:hypothetical protein
MIGISALLKETPESISASFAMAVYSKKIAVYEPGNRPSPDTNSAGPLLDFLPPEL